MKKSDVKFHADRGPSHPAICVKVRSFGANIETGEKALQFAWEMAQETFWERAVERVAEIFPGAKCYQEGRGGGWLTVHGLPPVEEWNGAMVAKWASLERWTRREIAHLTSPENISEDIEANEWDKPGAERFNFVDLPDGTSASLPDLKARAIAAGFGAVVRA